MEDKLSALLGNPQLMQQIMSMAQSLGQPPQQQEPAQPAASNSMPDPAMLQKLSGLTGSTAVDPEQKALLAALGPYLSRERVRRLEKAMQAAKMAKLASAFLGSGALQSLTGR